MCVVLYIVLVSVFGFWVIMLIGDVVVGLVVCGLCFKLGCGCLSWWLIVMWVRVWGLLLVVFCCGYMLVLVLIGCCLCVWGIFGFYLGLCFV